MNPAKCGRKKIIAYLKVILILILLATIIYVEYMIKEKSMPFFSSESSFVCSTLLVQYSTFVLGTHFYEAASS